MYRSNFIRNLPSIFFYDFKYQMNYASLNWNCSLRKWFAHFIDCSPFCSSPVVFGAESYVSVYIYVPHAGAELRIPLCCTYTYHEYGATNFLDIFWTKNPWPRPGQKIHVCLYSSLVCPASYANSSKYFEGIQSYRDGVFTEENFNYCDPSYIENSRVIYAKPQLTIGKFCSKWFYDMCGLLWVAGCCT